MQRSLAETLRVLRARQGWSLSKAGERLGVNRQTLRSLEVGERTPYYPTLLKIAQGYGVPVEDLMGLEPPRASSLLTPQTWQAWLIERGARHLAMPAAEFDRWFNSLPESERDSILIKTRAEYRRLRAELLDEAERASEKQRTFIGALGAYVGARNTEIWLQGLGFEPAPADELDAEEPLVSSTVVEVSSAREKREEAERQLGALVG